MWIKIVKTSQKMNNRYKHTLYKILIFNKKNSKIVNFCVEIQNISILVKSPVS